MHVSGHHSVCSCPSKEDFCLRFCKEINEITAKYCLRCGTDLEKSMVKEVLDIGIAQKETDLLKKAVKLLMYKADPKTRDEVLEIVKFYNEKPV